ncbi:MAG: hypothetical protein ACYC6R_00025 [Anaerolineales bacterium]
MNSLRILVRGANDVGSAVAHRLFMAGYAVIIHEIPQPATARRRMSFTDAVFDGQALLNGVTAHHTNDLHLIDSLLNEHAVIPVTVENIYNVIEHTQPQVLIDARMRKHRQPDPQLDLASLTIGLGPNFIAGETTHLAIETARGEALGRIISKGATSPLQGEPQSIAGHARDRYVYSYEAGTFYTSHQIGDSVQRGEEIARLNTVPLYAPIAGILRGLTHDGVPVGLHTKVIEVDPRTQGSQISGIGERPARIAESVITAIQSWEADHVH